MKFGFEGDHYDQARRYIQQTSIQAVISEKNILVYNAEILGQVLDISKGGLSFAYREETARINDLFLDLNLICRDQELSISSVFCKAVSDMEMEDESLSSDGNIRRCGVQFTTLTDTQSHLLDQFLAPQEVDNEESHTDDESE